MKSQVLHTVWSHISGKAQGKFEFDHSWERNGYLWLWYFISKYELLCCHALVFTILCCNIHFCFFVCLLSCPFQTKRPPHVWLIPQESFATTKERLWGSSSSSSSPALCALPLFGYSSYTAYGCQGNSSTNQGFRSNRMLPKKRTCRFSQEKTSVATCPWRAPTRPAHKTAESRHGRRQRT